MLTEIMFISDPGRAEAYQRYSKLWLEVRYGEMHPKRKWCAPMRTIGTVFAVFLLNSFVNPDYSQSS